MRPFREPGRSRASVSEPRTTPTLLINAPNRNPTNQINVFGDASTSLPSIAFNSDDRHYLEGSSYSRGAFLFARSGLSAKHLQRSSV
jgi:hypothetical protein